MHLDENQKKTVATWIDQGLKLSEIQNRLLSELGLKLTYMEVRFLVDDLKLVPKDLPPPAPVTDLGKAAEAAKPPSPAPPPAPAPASGGVSLTVDQLTRPGCIASGKATFSDGQEADWYVDQMGRLGLAPKQKGYRPSPTDVQEFQMALESQLARLGM